MITPGLKNAASALRRRRPATGLTIKMELALAYVAMKMAAATMAPRRAEWSAEAMMIAAKAGLPGCAKMTAMSAAQAGQASGAVPARTNALAIRPASAKMTADQGLLAEKSAVKRCGGAADQAPNMAAPAASSGKTALAASAEVNSALKARAGNMDHACAGDPAADTKAVTAEIAADAANATEARAGCAKEGLKDAPGANAIMIADLGTMIAARKDGLTARMAQQEGQNNH
jgi:hypothetical protein